MAEDFYKTLGVAKNATQDEIRTAYRKLARQLHPDVNKAPDAQAKFTKVQQAYDVLSDEQKRKLYDQFGHAAFEGGGGPPPGGAGRGPHYNWSNVGAPGGSGAGARGGNPFGPDFDSEDISSVFESIFGAGGAGGPGGPGYSNPFGAGQAGPTGGRGGRGRATSRGRAEPTEEEPIRSEVRIDFLAAARGSTESVRVTRGGNSRTIEVKVPAGIEDGASLRVRGAVEGRDLILTVRIEPHALFRRGEFTETGKGLDIYLDVPLTVAEATLGATVTIPTLGTPAELTIPPGTGSGRKLRLRGRGMRDAQGREGDLYVVTRILTPLGSELTPAQQEALRAMSAAGPQARVGPGWPTAAPKGDA